MSKAKKPDIKRVIELQSFLQNFHYIERVIHLSDSTERRETDTEHSYTLALLAWYLAQYFPELDTNKCIRYALVHDLVEIHAGDTFTFGPQDMIDSKVEREQQALIQMEQNWPDFKELTEDIHIYEELKSAESCFVYALDKIVPMIVIYLASGKTWHDYNISLDHLKENKKDKVNKSAQALQYYKQIIALLEGLPEYFPLK